MTMANDVNDGTCMFCGKQLVYCDRWGGKTREVGREYVTCSDDHCQTGAIRAESYAAPYQCKGPDYCPYFNAWHDRACDECGKIWPEDCEQNCEDCCDDMVSTDIVDRVLEDIKRVFVSYYEENGMFVPNTLEHAKEAIDDIIDNYDDGKYD